ncbi:SPOR domain-containing protein [Flavobacterium sp. SM2513]|uniref:SPOR domain-containing protein n=1 Tax=Flavobacterium sp. SM2513 TaxID=3424766 RepID=UPI003D7FC846
MTKNQVNSTITVFLFTVLFSLNSSAQTDKVTLSQDQKFEQLLNEKRKINNSIATNEGYKIQIYNGDNSNSRRELSKFKSDFNYLDATIIFSTPEYKVWVGNFKSKIDAERHLIEIQKKYSSSIIVNPTK